LKAAKLNIKLYKMRNEDLYHEVNDEQYRDQWRNAHGGGSPTIKDKESVKPAPLTVVPNSKKLYPHQISESGKAVEILKEYGIAMLCFEVRTGKTGTALNTAKLYGAKEVLFLTKLNAISSIQKDFAEFGFDFNLVITNYENLHNVPSGFDFFICDESHKLGQFPQPAEKTKLLQKMVGDKPLMLLSGTPSPESYSQLYHQFWISKCSPWAEYQNFYKWHKQYGIAAVKYLYNRQIADYSKTKKDLVFESINHLMLTYTQDEAGFDVKVEEEIMYVPLMPKIKWITEALKKDKLCTLKSGEVVLADTAVKEMQKLHQCYSGTVRTESGEAIEFEDIKAEFIKETFKGQKIAVFYCFIAEGMMLGRVFKNRVYTDPMAFNAAGPDAVYIGQVVSNREGVNVSSADCLVMFNIGFSALSYLQAPARIQTKDRVKPAKVYWVFTKGGIEDEIYESVRNKRDYTLSHYRENRKREAATK